MPEETPRKPHALRLPPSARSKDIKYYPYFQGAISRGLWRFFTYRFTRSTGWLLGLTLLFLSYGSSSLELQTYTCVAYLVSIWIVTLLMAELFRPRVRLEAQHADRVSVDGVLPVEVMVTQLRRTPQQLTVIPHELPPHLDAVPEDGAVVPLLGLHKTARISVGLRCTRRGQQKWGGFRVETEFPFHLWRSFRTMREVRSILVTPRFTPLSRVTVPPGRRYQPGGIAMASHLGDSFEYLGNREYRDGDNIRDIDWRATARLNRPIVREYREEYFLRVAVVLDTFIPRSAGDEQDQNFERAVSVCAAVSDCMARSEYVVDLFAAGTNLYHLTAGRSLAYLDQILEILACVEGSPVEPFDILEPEIAENLAQVTSVICVLLNWDERRQAFVEQLIRFGAGVKIIVVRNLPCTLNPADASVPGGVLVISEAMFSAGITEI